MSEKTIRQWILDNPPKDGEFSNQYLRRISKLSDYSYKSIDIKHRQMVNRGEVPAFKYIAVNGVSTVNTDTKKTEPPKRKLPKILIIDIETSPIKCFTWGLFKQDISISQVISDRFIICWSAKWLYDKEVLSDCCTPKEAVNGDDKRIIQSVYDLLCEADIVIAHNGKKFDLPIINTRVLKWGFKPIHPFQIVDTCLIARKQFGNISNKLDYMNGMLNLNQKIDTGGFKLWVRCLDGEKEALKIMEDYNKHDVLMLEELYIVLRPFIKSHPNLGLFNHDESVCPNCGSANIKDDGAFYYTMVAKYSTFRCECGYVGHIRNTALSLTERRKLTTTCAR